jgi:hypothetical protein
MWSPDPWSEKKKASDKSEAFPLVGAAGRNLFPNSQHLDF